MSKLTPENIDKECPRCGEEDFPSNHKVFEKIILSESEKNFIFKERKLNEPQICGLCIMQLRRSYFVFENFKD